MNDGKRSLWSWIVAALIGLPALYVASFGPVARLAREGIVDEKLVAPFYSPLFIVVDHCPEWVEGALVRYLMVCGVDNSD
jgi:hypothetical protein